MNLLEVVLEIPGLDYPQHFQCFSSWKQNSETTYMMVLKFDLNTQRNFASFIKVTGPLTILAHVHLCI